MLKLQHWQGVSAIFGLEAAPVLEFYFTMRAVRQANNAGTASSPSQLMATLALACTTGLA